MLDKKIKKYHKTRLESYFTGVLFCVIFFSGFLVCQNALAADKYIVKGANGTGASWSDAIDMPTAGTTFCNFNAATWVRGITYWVAGADTSYTDVCFRNVSGSGTITLKKATVASHGTDTGWDALYGTKQALISRIGNQAQSNILIDGSTGSGRSGYGFKMVGPAGVNTYAFTWPNAQVHDHLTIQYTEITSPTTPISDGCMDAATCTASGIYIVGTGGSADTLVFDHLWIHDVAVPFLMTATSNVTISNSIIERNDSTPAHHSEAMSINGTTTMAVFNNEFVDIEGTSVFAFMNQGAVNGVNIYNNIIRYTPAATQTGLGNGIFTCTNTGTVCTNIEYLNNTHVNMVGGVSQAVNVGTNGTASAWVVKNNLWWCSGSCLPARNTVDAQITYDTNWYGGVAYTGAENGAINGGVENPFTDTANYDFTLKAGSGPVGAGTDIELTSPDYAGNARSSVWDIGAYEYGASIGDTIPPAAPSGLAVS